MNKIDQFLKEAPLWLKLVVVMTGFMLIVVGKVALTKSLSDTPTSTHATK